MTHENRRLNIADEWRVADECWTAAEALAELRLWRQAVTQYYFAVYHAVMAALLTEGLEPKTHGGAASEFNRLFIKTGLLPASLSGALRHLEKDRQEADYNRTAVFTPDNAKEAQAEAAGLRNAVQSWLRAEGWLR